MREYHLHFHSDRGHEAQPCPDNLQHKLSLILQILENLMPLIDDLQGKMDAATTSIQKNSDLDDSIIALLNAETQQIKDLKAALDAAGTDPAKLKAISDAMDALVAKSDAEAQKKADAVTANTPADNPPSVPAAST
jgi:chromosome segregation ATPase